MTNGFTADGEPLFDIEYEKENNKHVTEIDLYKVIKDNELKVDEKYINPELYEAAYMDGAGRLRCIWHITLPGIKATFIVLLIINIGHLLEAGFEHQYLLKNGLVQDYAEVFNMYVLRYGFKLMRFSYAAVAGLFRSMVSIFLIVIANTISRKLGEETLV